MIKICKLLLFLLMIKATGYSQSNTTSLCDKIKTIFAFTRDWKKTDSSFDYPLAAIRKQSVFSGFIFDPDENRYASMVVLPNEIKSQFVTYDGRSSYMAELGPFTKDNIDKEGMLLRKNINACFNLSDWDITPIKGTYLQMSYKLIDIACSIIKFEDKKNSSTTLLISFLRFTPK